MYRIKFSFSFFIILILTSFIFFFSSILTTKTNAIFNAGGRVLYVHPIPCIAPFPGFWAVVQNAGIPPALAAVFPYPWPPVIGLKADFIPPIPFGLYEGKYIPIGGCFFPIPSPPFILFLPASATFFIYSAKRPI